MALQLSAVLAQSFTDSLAKLESPDSRTRMAAFYELFQPSLGFAVSAKDGTLKLLDDHPGDRDAIVQALVRLLSRENSIINRSAPGSLPESYGEYHASLIWSVATLRDGRATDALLGAIQTGGLATDGLVALGAAAMPAVLGALDSPDPHVRVGATATLGGMALQRDLSALDAADTERIRASLLRALKDGDYAVRWAAVLSLEPFEDAGVREAIRQAATLDTSERVRQAAREWLGKHQPK
jgi:HEAT repeat protein